MRFGVKGIKNFERTASQDRVIDARWSRVFPETNVIVGGNGALVQLRGMLDRNGPGSPGIPFGTCIVAYAEERNGQVPARQTTLFTDKEYLCVDELRLRSHKSRSQRRFRMRVGAARPKVDA